MYISWRFFRLMLNGLLCAEAAHSSHTMRHMNVAIGQDGSVHTDEAAQGGLFVQLSLATAVENKQNDDGGPCGGRLPAALPFRVPHDVIPDLDKHWKLQLPCKSIMTSGGESACIGNYTRLLNRHTGTPGVHTVQSRDLDTFVLMPRMYSNRFCSGGMYVALDSAGVDMVVLNVPVVGTTTSGSENTRVELRQMRGSFQAGFKLDNKDGMRTLKTTMSIQHLPQRYKSTSFVQIFNGGFAILPSRFRGGGPFIEIMTQRCQYSWQRLPSGDRCRKGSIGIGVWKDGKFGGKGGFLFEEYTLGTKFDLEVQIPGDGTIDFKYRHAGEATWLSKRTINCHNPGSKIRGCLYGQRNKASRYPRANGIYWKVGSYVQKGPHEEATDYALSYMYSADIIEPRHL